MLGHMGALLGDKRLLSMTNLHYEGELTDPWKFNKINRTMFKQGATPLLYGSSASCYELWEKKKYDYTIEQVQLFNMELKCGALGLANDFKDFIINNVKPAEEMTITVYEDTFDIECNRYRNVGEQTLRYDIFDSETGTIRRIVHTDTKRVADLDQFKRWFVTGLIHSIDSQVADFVMENVMDKYSWGLDIHDAFIVCPEAASDTRKWYAEEMQIIYDNRNAILTEYFRSIGINGEAIGEWKELQSKVVPIENFKASEWALK